MKKCMKNLIIISILLAMSGLITNISFATEITSSEKTKINSFINEDENIIFSYYNYSSVTKMPVENENCTAYGLVATIARKYGTNVEDQPENSEIYKITGNAKAKSFTRTVADSFVESKLGIKFNELEGYEEYQSEHTTSTDKTTFYQVLEGGGTPWEPEEYTVNDIRKLANGNIEVDVVYTDGTVDSDGKEIELRNTVTIQEKGESYIFISCIVSNNETDEKTRIAEFINRDENIVFSYYNYSTASKMPVQDKKCTVNGLVATIAREYGTNVEDQPENSEIYKITGNEKAKSFTRTVADSFVESKLGIKFNELEGYEEYQSEHTTSTDKTTFYQVLEGGGAPWEPEEYTVNDIRKLANGNIEVDLTYTDGTLDSNGEEIVHNGKVTIQEKGESYIFVSCEGRILEEEQDKTEEDTNKGTTSEQDKTEQDKDDTVVKGELPQTGDYIYVGKCLLGILVAILIVLVVRYKYSKK